MTGKEMWNAFVATHPEAADASYEAWCYGSDASDQLAELTVNGIKTATASAYPIYEVEAEPIPEAGTYSVILWKDESAACVIKTTRVFILPYKDVGEEQAYREGEGDRSLSYWRKVHEKFFAEEMNAAGLHFTEDMQVVCEEFEVVFK